MHSLLSFDVVEADKQISEELKQEIEKDGVIIYEKKGIHLFIYIMNKKLMR